MVEITGSFWARQVYDLIMIWFHFGKTSLNDICRRDHIEISIKTPKFLGKRNRYYLVTGLLDWMGKTGRRNQNFWFGHRWFEKPIRYLSRCWICSLKIYVNPEIWLGNWGCTQASESIFLWLFSWRMDGTTLTQEMSLCVCQWAEVGMSIRWPFFTYIFFLYIFCCLFIITIKNKETS